MATFRSKHTNQEIEAILDRSKEMDTKPFVLFYDKQEKKYRFFPTPEKRDAWEKARDTASMTPEIEAYQFTESFDAPAPYTITIGNIEEVRSVRWGKTGTTIDFYFLTVDSFSNRFNESVDIIYTIDSPIGSNTISMTYSCDTTSQYTSVSFNVDNYISIGKNVISVLVKGRSSGASKMSSVTMNVFELSISSSFQINQVITPATDFTVPVIVSGGGVKTLSIYVDGTKVATRDITESESGNLMTPVVQNSDGRYAIGKHTLQLIANQDKEYTNILYFEFVIGGKITTLDGELKDQRQILVQTELESGSNGNGILVNTNPTFYATQYENFKLSYAYYSSDTVNEYTAQIQWEIENSEMQIQPISLDSMTESKIGTISTLEIIPTEVPIAGTNFTLKAKVKDPTNDESAIPTYTYIDGAEYPFDISVNTKISETTSGLTMKLSAHGRSNEEPISSRTAWSYVKRENGLITYNYSTTFSDNFQWSGDYGWSNNALSVKSGTWCLINNKPFSSKIAPQDSLGCVFEIDFMTFDVDDDNAVVLSIGDPSKSPSLVIRGSKITLRSTSDEFTTQFKSNERVKIAYVIYPVKEDTSSYPRMVFIQVNGVLSYCRQYGSNDSFNIDSVTDPKYGMIKIGNENGGAGIKVYNIRTYNRYINMYEELNNYIIDSEGNLSKKIDANDVYSVGNIDVQKLASQITLVQIDGNIQTLIDAKEKDEIEGKVIVTSPTNPEINMISPHTKLSNAGQSTLNMPVPSMHVKLGAYEDNKVTDGDGNVLVGNRWAFRATNTPEKKFRLQANYMDSSGCHNGAFLKLFNIVSKKVKIKSEGDGDNGGKLVLVPPAIRFIYDTSANGYSAVMKKKHGENPNSKDGNWEFPYELNMVPDSIPCVVVWKRPGETAYKVLGQYVLMEEKKSDFTSCKRSIYDNVDVNGKPDPFAFRGSKGTRLWDNKDVRQFEIVSNVGEITYFNSVEHWDEINPSTAKYRYETDFEMIYPDPDDIIADEGAGAVKNYWNEFKDKFVAPICNTYKNQAEFNKLYCDGPDQILDRWAWAAYYCLALRHCCVDSLVRNMQIMTFGETTSAGNTLWLPKWWDVDMQCGLLQSGAIGAQPASTRETKVAGSYLFSGKNSVDESSSWLWDALEGCEQFRKDVNTIDGLLYNNGWRYDEITKIQDEDFVNTWNESLFNENGLVKYVNIFNIVNNVPIRTTAYLYMLQGDRTPHRHWFLRTSYSYFDAVHNCGDYVNNSISFTPFNAPKGTRFIVTPSEDFYFGYGINKNPQASGIVGKKGEEVKVDGEYMAINADIGSKDTVELYAINKLEKIDISDFVKYYNGTMDLSRTRDTVLGTVLKELYLGARSIDLINNETDAKTTAGNSLNSKEITFQGISTMSRLEVLNIRGIHSMRTVTDDVSAEISLQSLKRLYAAGSGLKVFHPKTGSTLEYLELPTSISEVTMKDCELPLSGDIDWYETRTTTRTYITSSGDTAEEEAYYVVNNNHLPTSELKTIDFQAMGKSKAAQQFILNWLHVIRDSAVITPDMTEEQKENALNEAFSTCRLTYTNCTWSRDVFQNMSYEDLILLSRIPELRRNLNGGYIVCDEALTTEQMNELMKRFGDYIFTDNSLLMIDSTSDNIKVSITGDNATIIESGNIPTIEVLHGCKYKLSGIVFPVKRASKDEIKFSWYLSEKSYQPQPDGSVQVIYTPRKNSSSDIISTINPILLNQKTGELEIIESHFAAIEGDKIMLNVEATVDGNSKTGQVFLNVKRRTYPSEVTIEPPDTATSDGNNIVIIDSGEYKFSAVHSSPSDYNGNLSSTNGGVWSIEPFESDYLGYESTDKDYSLLVYSNFGEFIDEEKTFKLSYTSNWMDKNISCSTSLNLTIISVIQDVIVAPLRGGNRAVYYAIENRNGFRHTGKGEDGKLNGSYSSLDLKLGTGAIYFRDFILDAKAQGVNVDVYDFTSLSSTSNDTGNTYNIVKYMQNISELNLSGCFMFNTEVVVTNMTNLKTLNMSGTAEGANANIGEYSYLTSLTYGTPTYIDITRPRALTTANVDVQNTKLINTITLNNMEGGKEVSLLTRLINHESTYESLTADKYNEVLPALTSIHINTKPDAAEDNLGQTGDAIEKLRKIIESHNLSDDSTIVSKIRTYRLYADSKIAIREKFPNLTINNNEVYRRWNDRTFEKRVSATAANLGGDGVGITLAQAANINNTSLNGVIKNVPNVSLKIKDLSDLHNFTNLQFASHNNEADSEFFGCDNVEKLSIPANTTAIGTNTFTHMQKLSSLDFSHASKLERIEHLGFSNCGNETVKMDIKFGTGIGNASTAVCPSLKYVDLCGIKPLKSIEVANHSLIETLAI